MTEEMGEKKAKKKEYMKLWREKHKEQIKDERKQYYEQNKEQKKQYYIENKNEINKYCKKYYIENKDKLIKKSKQYREQNKDKIKESHKKYYNKNKIILQEQRKQKREKFKIALIQYNEINRLFIGSQFDVYFIDLETFEQSKKLRGNPIEFIEKHIISTNYLVFVFARNHLRKFEKQKDHWEYYWETKRKRNGEYSSIDPVLTSKASEIITLYHNQIHQVVLCGGDKDIISVLELALRYKIDIRVIASNRKTLSYEISEIAQNKIEYVYE